MERRVLLLALGCVLVMIATRILVGDVEVVEVIPPGQDTGAYFLRTEGTRLTLVAGRLFLMAAFTLCVMLLILAGLWIQRAYARFRRK
ncbi:MAG: hypothetical protein AAGF78_03405 [Pseudomonadota bacterium]